MNGMALNKTANVQDEQILFYTCNNVIQSSEEFECKQNMPFDSDSNEVRQARQCDLIIIIR